MASHLSRSFAGAGALVSAGLLIAAPAAFADAHNTTAAGPTLGAGTLAIAGTTYPSPAPNITVGQPLPGVSSSAAVADGSYPYVFNNDGPDPNFAVSSPIDLWDVNNGGQVLDTVQVPTSAQTTSFSSKSELALNLSTDGRDLTWSGYNAPVDQLDASNSNTPNVVDSTNPDVYAFYREVGDFNNSTGGFSFTDTNTYSGDNGRAALLDNSVNQIYMSGNSNSGTTKTWAPLVADTGAQVVTPGQDPSTVPAHPLATFSAATLAALGTSSDKPGKDTNFRGLTEYDGVVYYTKGSGSNGVNTVYFVDTDNVCQSGVGLPVAGQPVPTAAGAAAQPGGSYQLCVLKGFNTSKAKTDTTHFPFGIWFANPTTLYVADEGDGGTGYDAAGGSWTDATPDSTAGRYAGLQKWVFANGRWNYAYTIQTGLNLGRPYTVAGYPTGDNAGTGLPWAPATDGLRNISGHVNGDGSATIYATTSTVSGSGDPGADPNEVVKVTDELAAPSAGDEAFTTVAAPKYGVRYGGVAWLPKK